MAPTNSAGVKTPSKAAAALSRAKPLAVHAKAGLDLRKLAKYQRRLFHRLYFFIAFTSLTLTYQKTDSLTQIMREWSVWLREWEWQFRSQKPKLHTDD